MLGGRSLVRSHTSTPVLSLLTNTSSMDALQARATAVRELAVVRNRLSTGLRVAGAKDEAASYVIARQTKAEIAGWGAVLDSLVRGRATVSVGRLGVEAMSDLLIRVRETLLSLTSASDEEERGHLREQVKALVSESDAIAHRSTYNGVNLLTAPPPPKPPPQPAAFLLPMPAAPGSGVLTFTVPAGMAAGRVMLELDLGAGQSEVEIYQGTKRQAATTRGINSGGPARPASGVQVIGFDYDPTDGNGQTLSIRFNENYAGSNGWAITALRMEYPPQTAADRGDLSVLATPRGQTVRLERRALLSGALGIDQLTTEPIADALGKIEAAIATVNAAGAYFGSVEAELEREGVFGDKLRSTLEAQVGSLVDADLPREGARLSALLAREQLASLTLNIAGAQTKTLLDLFQPRSESSGLLRAVA